MRINGQTPEQFALNEQRRAEEREWARLDAEARKARVLALENDGKWVTVEFINDAGERIVAEYKRCGYLAAPSELLHEINDRLRKAKGPMTTIGSRKALARIHKP